MQHSIRTGTRIGFIISWFLLLGYFIATVMRVAFFAPLAIDVSRRVTAPNGRTTALLVREYAFDLNFRLYLVDSPWASVPSQARQAVWSSQDYDPTDRHNWREEVEWSSDSSLVAISIEQHYVFGYDLTAGRAIENSLQIRQLLIERSTNS
jgi:hypothetical protein